MKLHMNRTAVAASLLSMLCAHTVLPMKQQIKNNPSTNDVLIELIQKPEALSLGQGFLKEINQLLKQGKTIQEVAGFIIEKVGTQYQTAQEQETELKQVVMKLQHAQQTALMKLASEQKVKQQKLEIEHEKIRKERVKLENANHSSTREWLRVGGIPGAIIVVGLAAVSKFANALNKKKAYTQ